jgi:O-antigen/teichoic acid export membrane protein
VSSESFSLRFARNAGFILLGRGWYLLIWFAVTPYVLSKLGPERFGVWSLLFLLSGYLATLDLGLGASVIKFTAEHSTGNQWETLHRTLGDISRLYLVLGILWIIAVFALHPLIINRIGVSATHYEEVRFALLASAVIFALANLVSTGPGVLNGLQRMDLSNGIQVAASIPQLVVLIGGLARGYGLYAVVASTAVQWLAVAILSYLVIHRVAPEVGWPALRLRGRQKGWLRFSAVLQVSTILVLTQLQVDKLLIALWIGLASVTEFELGFRVANGIQSLPVLALVPLLPAFAELHAGGKYEEARSLLRKGTLNLSGWAFGIAASIIPVAPFLVRAWVGPDHGEAEILAVWLLAAYLLNLCTGVGSAAVRGAGRPGIEIAPMLVALVLHLVASRILLDRMGPIGAGPATFAALALWSFLFFIRVSKWSGIRFFDFAISALARPTLAFLPAFGLGLLAVSQWPESLTENRISILIAALVTAAAGAGLYWILWRLLGRWPLEPSGGERGAG